MEQNNQTSQTNQNTQIKEKEKIVKLGKEKEVKIYQWKTKAKKDFIKKIKEKKEQITEEDILEVLFNPYVEPNDIYFSEDEIQYLLVQIRDFSIKDDIKFRIKCSSCSDIIEVKTRPLDIVKYQENQYPTEIDNVVWKDIKLRNTLEIAKHKLDMLPWIVEMLLHIEKANGEEIKSLEEVVYFYENLSLDESSKLEEDYDKVRSLLSIEKEIKCPHCNETDTYFFKEVPKFFDPLLPKVDKVSGIKA